MEPPMRNSLTFISSEVAETLVSKRKQSIKSTSGQRRMTGGADGRASASPSKTSNKILVSGFPTSSKTQRNFEQSRCSTQNVEARTDSLRALANGELTKTYPSTNSILGAEELLKKGSLDDEPICFCVPYATRSSGEKKIDEMMDYAIQNLNEAGKSLSNLGDNFEHDLKLMFMDIMGRVQHWVTVVQNRIQAAKVDLETLQKESIANVSDQTAKDLELLELRRKLGEAEAKLAIQQKQRLEIIPDVANSSEQGSQTRQERVSTASVQTATDEDRLEERDEVQRGSAVTSANTGCQSEEDRETATNREAELEAELAQLLEENERMMKERVEYENAIQCALLKGVSSLNIEALKVLRCPPIPCCTPCGLSSPRSSSPPRTRRCDALPRQPLQKESNAGSKNDKTKSRSGATNTNCSQSMLENFLYCNGSSERCPENSMVFLLHHGDAGNQFQPCIQNRHRSTGSPSNKGTVCAGGKCRKPASTTSTKEKISCTTRFPGSRPASYDLCVRNRDDSGENGTARKNTLVTKRCGACNGNRRNRED